MSGGNTLGWKLVFGFDTRDKRWVLMTKLKDPECSSGDDSVIMKRVFDWKLGTRTGRGIVVLTTFDEAVASQFNTGQYVKRPHKYFMEYLGAVRVISI
jgi:hypothetical protein